MKDQAYKVVSQIPRGKVMTYGQVAAKAGLKSPRTVGRYLHQNTDSKKVPCHRVVRSDGSIASGYAMGGPTAQKKKLIEEGVIFDNRKVSSVSLLK